MSSVTKRPEPSPTKTNGTPPHKKPEVALAEVIVPVAENDGTLSTSVTVFTCRWCCYCSDNER